MKEQQKQNTEEWGEKIAFQLFLKIFPKPVNYKHVNYDELKPRLLGKLNFRAVYLDVKSISAISNNPLLLKDKNFLRHIKHKYYRLRFIFFSPY